MHSYGPLMQPSSADKDVSETINTDITAQHSVCKWVIASRTPYVSCVALVLPQLTVSRSLQTHYTTVFCRLCSQILKKPRNNVPNGNLTQVVDAHAVLFCNILGVCVHTWAVGAHGSGHTPVNLHRHELMMTFKSCWPSRLSE